MHYIGTILWNFDKYFHEWHAICYSYGWLQPDTANFTHIIWWHNVPRFHNSRDSFSIKFAFRPTQMQSHAYQSALAAYCHPEWLTVRMVKKINLVERIHNEYKWFFKILNKKRQINQKFDIHAWPEIHFVAR